MTGGNIGSYYGGGTVVEVLKMDGAAWCTLPELPKGRVQHTQSGLLACGGYAYTDDQGETCVKFSNGHWNISHQDLDDQYDHSAWSSSKHGTRLISGFQAELLADNGLTPDSFRLQYYTT